MTWTLFHADRAVVSGSLAEAAGAAVGLDQALVFDDGTGKVVDLDLRGSAEDVAARYAAVEPVRGRGRPKLGVTAREVTLLPRHWDWLAQQPAGASVALRKLVEAAARADQAPPEAKRRREAAYRFMSAVAGDRPGYEEAIRALFADDRAGFDQHAAAWPKDVRDYAARLAWDERAL